MNICEISSVLNEPVLKDRNTDITPGAKAKNNLRPVRRLVTMDGQLMRYFCSVVTILSFSLSSTASIAVEIPMQATQMQTPVKTSAAYAINIDNDPLTDQNKTATSIHKDILDRIQEPPNSLQLTKLQSAVNFYTKLAITNQWQVTPKGKLLSFGEIDPHVRLLRNKLVLLGDHPPIECTEEKDELFDIELHEALIRFQTRHGGKPDGILGPQTRSHLNVTPYQRVNQLKVNIARIKDFSPNTDRFIQVNIPEYRLYLYEHNQPILSMKTIVGKKKRKTPVFNSLVDRIVVNPSWHVPKSIAYKDIIPALKEDPNHLTKMNLKVVTGWGDSKKFIATEDIDYEKLYTGKNYQRFWEAPSKKNTLGSVKFLTNGPYSVYLHDTSAKRLFNESNRAYSSGCIRLEQPRKLADELMRMTHGWTSSKLDSVFKQTKTKQYHLNDPIPLHVTYWTAWVDSKGLTHFRSDIYKRDKYQLSIAQSSD